MVFEGCQSFAMVFPKYPVSFRDYYIWYLAYSGSSTYRVIDTTYSTIIVFWHQKYREYP